MRMFILALVLVALTGCGDSPKADNTVNYTADDSFSAMGETGTKALQVFQQACPRFAEMAADFEDVKVSTLSQGIPAEFGWSKGIEVSFKVKDQPQDRRLVESRSFGHSCVINLGGGLNPGFISSKSACSSICGVMEEKNGVYFGSIPDMAVIESTTDAQAVIDKRLSAGKEKLEKLTKQALAGDYQSQRNLAYAYQTGETFAPLDRIRACSWRAIIIASKSKHIDESDHSNLAFSCEKLSNQERKQALNIAQETIKNM